MKRESWHDGYEQRDLENLIFLLTSIFECPHNFTYAEVYKGRQWTVNPELIKENGYEGPQTSKGELFVKVFGMSRDFEGAHIDFKMAASVWACSDDE